MDHPLTTAELLDVMRVERSNWESLLAEIGKARLIEPGVEGDWSIRDIAAHLTYYESRVADWLGAIQKGEQLPQSEFAGQSIDDRNAVIYERNRALPLDDVLRDSRVSFQRSIDVVQGLRDEDLHDIEFTRRNGFEWSAHDIIAGDTYEHYQEHIASVRAWLAKQPATQSV